MINKELAKKVIYTAITGEHDTLITPKYINKDWDYICFTDNPSLSSDFWEIIEMEPSELDPVRKARKYKILPHKYLPNYDCSLWFDGNFEIWGDVNQFISAYNSASAMLCMVHPLGKCIYEEAVRCVFEGSDYPDIIKKQVAKYLEDGYPADYGLIASGVLFRNHNDTKLQKVMLAWWNEVEMLSKRDQLSFNYVCWKNNYTYDISDLPYWYNEFFRMRPHDVLNTQLFWKHGIYSEERSLRKQAGLKNQEFKVSFSIQDCGDIRNAETLRFDPSNLAIRLAQIKAVAYSLDGSSHALNPLYANHTEVVDGALVFSHQDPQIEFASDGIDWDLCSHIEFSGKIVIVDE